MPNDAEIVIAGGGFAGLALALALRQGLGRAAHIVVGDPALAAPAAADGRASAFAAASRRLLAALGVWPQLTAAAQPILDMVVTDSRTADAVRPTLLTFAGEVEPGEPFAHMIENRVVLDALAAACRDAGIEMVPAAVLRATDDAGGARILAEFADGRSVLAHLVAAADGGRSHLRQRAGIATLSRQYRQSGIVATLGLEFDHDSRAEEHFLPSGPFAFLPLTGRRASIVWTDDSSAAAHWCRLAPEAFVDEVAARLGARFGRLTLIDAPRAFPLRLMIAREFVKGRLALVGDAAHVIHPVAGQGLNLGLRDIAALAEAMVDAARLGLDLGGPEVLERYARWRRFDTLTMAAATDGLNRLFSTDAGPLRLVRDIGLGVVERMPGVKQLIIREAAGLGGAVPRLLRGEAI
ncbi:ubiquinone biosynthesis hydroxylase [Blastochloris viridis]|uniref:2-octaprenyl-3-methyl-6-methoxy-1,4-benzoquinol hydroxylase n=1 Tax=Blastochloris viridis TaxID=1079 RepID=A0A0H5BCE8_BLAVI|nr:ubiquinone biosynthesis hydroxylase [Blastochloris viridis]ALK07927.1 2-octaprenylphenol hydroxylase [Blastochloris viridis]BAR98819.1 2-octaprenyl-6-methoxyphenol hydroxylase [Blastochloris viridis]CUU43849.1 2-octaprenyl-3-methyl-6-methoxy-1,4-benzoquinol hydroxylase [Blastochloris viridis]